jgi:hypothetical protein
MLKAQRLFGSPKPYLIPLITLLAVNLIGPGAVTLLAAPAGASDPTSGPRHKIEVHDATVGAQIVAQGGKLIADYGSYALYDAPQAGADLSATAGAELRDEYNLVRLNAVQLDTSKPETQALRKAVGSFNGKHLHLVQFAGPPRAAWRDDLLQAGAQIITYIPENTYLVYGDAQSLARIQALAAAAPHVQWEATYLDDYKIHPRARTTDAKGKPREIGTDEFAIQLVADAVANAGTLKLVDGLKLAPIRKQHTFQHYLNVIVRIAPENLKTIAAQPEVVSIQPYFIPKKNDERQGQIIAGNLTGNVPSNPGYLIWLASKGFTQGQFTASGFAADVTDSGLDDGTTLPNHPGLYVQGDVTMASRVIYNRLEGFPNTGSTLVGCDGHGTLNSHVIGGYDDRTQFPHVDSSGYHYGLGICPFVKLGSSVIFDPDFFTFPDFTDLQSRAYHDGARVSNNSWGANTFGSYTSDSQEYDALVRDAEPAGAPFPAPGNQEMVIVFAAGNAGQFGAESVGSPGTGKNVFTIGAGENVQPMGNGGDGCGIPDSGADSANDIIFFSSRGPCTDGRIKPDLMAPGTHVTGGVAQAPNPGPNGTADPCFVASGVCGSLLGMFFPQGQEFFTVSSGTSHSTPCVVGGCALLRQYFLNNFTNTPSPAMTKAYLMNSARYMTGTGARDTLPSNNQGMGEMNLGTAFDGTPRVLRDQLPADLFTGSGQSVSFTNSVADPTKDLRITLAWTDAPGNTAGNSYNNNLDLTVTIGGTVYKGNVFRGAYSTGGGTADSKNNVESVFLPPGTSGNFVVTVSAVNINSDGVPNNSFPLDQDFALVMYNATPPVPTINSITPTNVTLVQNQPVSFTVSASGQGLLTYQWHLNGVDLSGATDSTYVNGAVGTADAGAYTVTVANQFGGTLSPAANLTVIPTVPLEYALNNSNLLWATDLANNPWYGQTNVSHDAKASAKSYFIGDSQQTVLTTTTNGPGQLTFYWKVSSETNADFLTFTSTGGGITNTAQISGEVDWQPMTVLLPSGFQTLQWTYSKNASGSAGSDAGWVDQVNIVPGYLLPSILKQPASTNTFAASPVTFSVAATGTPPLSYQWRVNNNPIAGATSSTLLFPAPNALDTGVYSVQVSNPFGFVTSASASLGVVPLAVRGDNTLNQINISLLATNAIAIAAGSWHSLILRSDDSLLAFGDDSDGQIDLPANLTNVLAIAAGGYHSLALNFDGTVTAWGNNFYDQTTVPPGLSNVTAVAAGTWHSMALSANGTVVAWGLDTSDQTSVPQDLAHVVAIAAAGNHSLALCSNGTVVAWGDNYDALGDFAGQSFVPFDLTNVVAIGAGDYHSLAIKADGSVVTWGLDSDGQCDVPASLTNAVAIVGGNAHTVALKPDSTIAAFGNDWNGQCDFPAGVSNVVAMAAGYSHTILLQGDRFAPPRLLRPTRRAGQFSLAVLTIAGKNYTLEYKNSLSVSAWTGIVTVRGNGAQQLLTDSAAIGPWRFYRVRQW